MGFINGFVSYLILLLIFVAVGSVGIFLGITLRKNMDAKPGKKDTADSSEA